GASQSASGSAVDAAGNSASAGLTGVNVDKTAPTLSGAPTTPPNADGWYNGNVTIHWTAADGLSGIAPASVPADSVITGEDTGLTAGASVSDRAGNSTNANSWNNTDVVVLFTCGDDLSGVASCTGPQTMTTEGIALTVLGTAVDSAGNSASDPALVSIDKTAPTIGAAPDRATNPNGWYK